MICIMGSRARRLQQKISQSDATVSQLRRHLSVLKANSTTAALEREEKHLKAENESLKNRVDDLKRRLIDLETRHGCYRPRYFRIHLISKGLLEQIPLPTDSQPKPAAEAPVKKEKTASAPKERPKQNDAKPDASKEKQQPKKEGKKEKTNPTKKDGDAAGGGDAVDVSRLDMRIGEIIDVKLHPDADSLYMETVNVGEETPRTILSGLVKHVPIEQMMGRRAVFLCNLKPAKMRGVMSQGMIMCASSDGKIEVLGVPDDAVPGDLVSVEGYPRTPDAQLNPKKKIFEKLKPDLVTDAEGCATYKCARWIIEGKGYLKAKTLTNAQIS